MSDWIYDIMKNNKSALDNINEETDTMNTQINNMTIKELTARTRKYKLEAITILIDSIAADKVYDVRVARETEIECDIFNDTSWWI